MSTTLFGKFIANTYQKVLQYDENDQYVTIANFDIADLLDSKYTLLNGAGQALPGIAIDHTDQGNGGLYIKETIIDPTGSAWGLQHCYGIGAPSNTDPGIQFWRPYEGNFHLFLKNTGNLFVGYKGENSVPVDVATYSLYVKNGIQVGTSSAGNKGRINLIGADPLEDGAGMFINGEHPFRTLRYRHFSNFDNDRTRKITDIDNSSLFSVNEWSAHITGIFMNAYTGTKDAEGLTAIMVEDSGSWAIRFNIYMNDDRNKAFVIDVLLIRKGLYDDFRNLDSTEIDTPGTNTNPWTPLI
jgi:hypothetical protein